MKLKRPYNTRRWLYLDGENLDVISTHVALDGAWWLEINSSGQHVCIDGYSTKKRDVDALDNMILALTQMREQVEKFNKEK